MSPLMCPGMFARGSLAVVWFTVLVWGTLQSSWCAVAKAQGALRATESSSMAMADQTIQGRTLTFEISRDAIRVLDPFDVEVTIKVDPQDPRPNTWRLESAEALGDFELLGTRVLSRGRSTTTRPSNVNGENPGESVFRIRLRIQALVTGQASLGPMTFVPEIDPEGSVPGSFARGRNTSEDPQNKGQTSLIEVKRFQTKPIRIRVERITPVEMEPGDFRDLKPAAKVPGEALPVGRIWSGIAALVAAGILVGLAGWFSRRRGRTLSPKHFVREIERIDSAFDRQERSSGESAHAAIQCVIGWLATEVGDAVYSQSTNEVVHRLREHKWPEDRVDQTADLLAQGDRLRYSGHTEDERDFVRKLIAGAKDLLTREVTS